MTYRGYSLVVLVVKAIVDIVICIACLQKGQTLLAGVPGLALLILALAVLLGLIMGIPSKVMYQENWVHGTDFGRDQQFIDTGSCRYKIISILAWVSFFMTIASVAIWLFILL